MSEHAPAVINVTGLPERPTAAEAGAFVTGRVSALLGEPEGAWTCDRAGATWVLGHLGRTVLRSRRGFDAVLKEALELENAPFRAVVRMIPVR